MAGSDLTIREMAVLRLLAEGLTNKQIGLRLGASEGTIKVHLKTVYTKLGVHNRASAAVWATRTLDHGVAKMREPAREQLPYWPSR